MISFDKLEPGACIKTPEVFRALGWESPDAIFLGGTGKFPSLAIPDNNRKGFIRTPWPCSTGLGYAPVPEFEQIESKDLIALRRKDLTGTWGSLTSHYTTGCDPEFFVVDANRRPIPARTFLAAKYPHGIYYDGVQGEFAVQARGCLEELGTGIRNQLWAVQDRINRAANGGRLTIQGAFELTPEEMSKLSDEDIRFRCSTSLNIYDDLGEIPDARQYPWRFAGGHIHIGCGAGKTAPTIRAMVRGLDGILGVAGVSLARNFDNPERRRMYGRAGEFRLPKHGLEYRVLSNFWITSPPIYHLVMELARFAYRLGESGAFPILYEGTEAEIRDCINGCDVRLAEKLIDRNRAMYKTIFDTIWGGGLASSKAWETVRNGLEVAVRNPDDIPGNWMINDSSWGSYGHIDNASWGRKVWR